jgi:NAD(P)-dependent dehydrogenase (short-subunit alcohol dehydrogenase family)
VAALRDLSRLQLDASSVREEQMKLLAGKVAIVTGASAGIGYATAKLFAREGARVVVAARRLRELNILVAEITEAGDIAAALAGDVADETFAKALVELATNKYGGVDIAFNNAGTLGKLGLSVSEMALTDWNDTLATSLGSAFLGAKYQIPAMLKRAGGSLIFTSSFVGYTVGFPQTAAYAASKAGMIGLTKALAAEYGPQKIRVNALLPGGTDTPMGRTFADTPEAIAFVKSLHALKRIAEPQEIANSALYLASEMSSFTTGTALLADGGVSINRT